MCFREQMPLDWLNAAAIWLPANKARLGHLLLDPIEASPVLIRASIHHPLNQLVFWEGSNPSRVRGWAFVHGTSGTWNIIRGDEQCFEAYLQGFGLGEKAVFEYVRDDERGFYSRILGVDPVPFALYYETTQHGLDAMHQDPVEYLLPDPYKARAFDPARARDWLAFQGYPADEQAYTAYARLEGLQVSKGRSIVASVHDGLSLLPFQVPEAAINGIKVSDDERGKGICTRMLRAFLDRLFRSGKRRVGLFVDGKNVPAVHCYEHAGFVKKSVYYKVELDPTKSSS